MIVLSPDIMIVFVVLQRYCEPLFQKDIWLRKKSNPILSNQWHLLFVFFLFYCLAGLKPSANNYTFNWIRLDSEYSVDIFLAILF